MGATPEVRYRIGSITKSYTATMVLQLIEAGRLTLDDTLARYFPDIPGAGAITIEQLLRHRSGIHNFTEDPRFLAAVTTPTTRARLLALLAGYDADFAPGERFAYSNSNYLLLGFLVEDLTGLTYAAALDSLVLRPLALKRTSVADTLGAGAGVAVGHTWDSRTSAWTRAEPWNLSWAGGAGALSATAADVAAFYTALGTGRLVGDSTLARMVAFGADSGYGLGLLALPHDGQVGFGHDGQVDGFLALAGYLPQDSLAVVWLGNGTRTTPNEIMLAALGAVYGRAVAVPDFATAVITVDPDTLAALAGTYTNPDFPLDIAVFAEGAQLFAQATGQGAFPLEAYPERVFRFDGAGIELTFAGPGEMRFRQGPLDLVFRRE